MIAGKSPQPEEGLEEEHTVGIANTFSLPLFFLLPLLILSPISSSSSPHLFLHFCFYRFFLDDYSFLGGLSSGTFLTG